MCSLGVYMLQRMRNAQYFVISAQREKRSAAIYILIYVVVKLIYGRCCCVQIPHSNPSQVPIFTNYQIILADKDRMLCVLVYAEELGVYAFRICNDRFITGYIQALKPL